MKTLCRACSLIVVLLSVGRATAEAKEVAIQRSALPAKVSAALDARYPGAEILGLTRETTKGVTVYEVEMKRAGKRLDALFEENGTLREEEAEIAETELPKAVRDSLAHSAQAKWVIERAERITPHKASSPPRYELLAVHGKNRLELVYAADGHRLGSKKATD